MWDEQTILAVGDNLDTPATLTMAVGAQRTAREFFKRIVPSPLELENAIATVEDEVLRARTLDRPASHEGLPDDKPFAATLLILRELMHHLQFAAVRYVDLADQA